MKYLIHDKVKMITQTESDVEPMSIYQVLACDDPDATARDMGLLHLDGKPFPPLPVPEEVTPRQFRLALLKSGTSPSSITAALGQLPVAQREAALVEWEFASVIRRDHPLMTAIAAMFGKSSSDIDAIFREAGR